MVYNSSVKCRIIDIDPSEKGLIDMINDGSTPRRPRRRKRRWQYYIPTIMVGVLALVCIAAITVTVITIAGSMSGKNPGKDTEQHQVLGGGNKITINTTSSGDSGDTEPEPKPEAGDIDKLIKEADFIAAGYDYQKAIEMLKAHPDYDSASELQAKVDEYTAADKKLVVYSRPDTITHIFFHSLVVDNARAFDGDSDQNGYNMYMTTVSEFIAILEQMYAKGYVLISPYDMAHEVTNEDGTTSFQYGKIRLPAGKTPFLMSQDDLNYYCYMVGNGNGKNETPIFNDYKYNDGFASRIVIDEKTGYPVCEYVDAEGNVHYGDYDLVPILETFIQNHPDFSYHGARAILGMTGYEGVFGYRTKPSYEAKLNELYAEGKYPYTYAEEVQMAKDVAQCLRDHGWVLASHSYGHPRYGDITAARVEADSTKWEETVQPIIGDCDVILYPNGSDINGVGKYTNANEKFNILYEDGYRYFFNVDGHQYWNQLGSNYFRGGRRNLDGYRMYHNPEKLTDLFDVDEVFDKDRPTPVPTIGGGM